MDEEWKRLRDAWQATAPSPAELSVRAAKGRRALRLSIAVEWAASAIVVAYWAWMARVDPRPVTYAFGGGSVLFLVVWLVALRRILGPGLRTAGEGVRDHLAAAVDRARNLERWFDFVRRCIVALAIGVVPLVAWKLYADRAMYLAEPWRAGVGIGGIYVILLGLWFLSAARRQAGREEAARLEAALRAFDQG